MDKIKITGEKALQAFHQKIQDLLSDKANKTELHEHGNKPILDQITQGILDEMKNLENECNTIDIRLGSVIPISLPCSKGLVACTNYSEKTYGSVGKGSFFIMPYPLLYLDEELKESDEEYTLYSQKIVDIKETALFDETHPFIFERGQLIYMKGKLSDSHRLFSIESQNFLVQQEPEEWDGFDYMLLGLAVSDQQFLLFPDHPIYSYTNNCFCELGLSMEKKQEHIVIASSEFVANTDEYAAYYPYCYDFNIMGMTDNCWFEVNYSPETTKLGCMSMQARSMNGFLRLYAESLPQTTILIENIIWKEIR